ncbi:MAG: hypothetical protein JSR97_12225 [Verrucomicrobia bacterium]|nr:hypothetical protein [Verrucomicrobiota bacterium]
MGNYRQQENISATSFLEDGDAKEIFAKIDYALKNGKHIQRWQHQEDMFSFLEKHFVSMQLYYMDFFGVSLETGGESIDKYYYLEFRPDNRGSIPNDNRHFLPNEHVIIGFMLHKILYIDGMIEVNTLPSLQRTIRQEYEDIKPGIYRALAKAKKIKTTEIDDQKVDDMVEKALRDFAKIGWIELDGLLFEPLPSFQRLPKIYGDYINDPDRWLKEDAAASAIDE